MDSSHHHHIKHQLWHRHSGVFLLHEELDGKEFQLKLCGPKTDPSALLKMDIALADFLHSHCLPFALAEDPKLLQMLQIARSLGPNYKPPTRELISGK